MKLFIHLHHLIKEDKVLNGSVPVEDMDFDIQDEVIHLNHPLSYELNASLKGSSLLVCGRLSLRLDCECVRCLRAFETTVHLRDWACLIPLEGEEKAEIISDSVDLTPYLREDILLAFPQNPHCGESCPGMKRLPGGVSRRRSELMITETPSTLWSELDKFKLS